MSADRLSHLPASVAFDTAAAASLTYQTAYHALVDRGALRAGERLLVLGAGVGSAAVELGKLLGAHVIAAASSESKLAMAGTLGADETFLYERSDDATALARSFKARFAEPLDVVVDPVGGCYSAAALRRLSYGGRLLAIGFTAGLPQLPLNLPLLKSCQVVGVNLGALLTQRPDLGRANADILAGLLAQGRINPAISARIGLEAAAEALTRLAERRLEGKIVVAF